MRFQRAAGRISRLGEHGQGGVVPEQACLLEIKPQGGLKSGKNQFVAAQGAHQWIGMDAADVLAFADQKPGLRPAEHLVAAEGDHIDACGETVLNQGL